MATYGTSAGESIDGTSGSDSIYARAGDDTVTGTGGNDNLHGQDGNDTLYGGAGTDQLDGGIGADTLVGGEGNDVYIVDNVGDLVIEFAGEGFDTVKSYISYTLGANLERLDLQGTADLTGLGNSLDNTLKGNSGNNYLNGFDGNDGIDGGGGNDYIIGGAGNDAMVGGIGIDTVSYEDATNAVTVSLAITTASQVTGWGKDKISGFENLTGSNFDDHLTGDSGDNRIVGGTGDDVMAGGAGDDRYSVDSVNDIVTETVGEGIDQVLASVDWTLSASTENLTMFGAAIVGIGNSLDNVIRGNSNGNVLNGKGGHDNIYGLAGADTFVFDNAQASSSDKVHDFQHGTDKIQVSAAGFGGGLVSGQVFDLTWFVTTSGGMPVSGDHNISTSNPFATTDAHGQFIFDKYQNLWWDADGSGAGQATLVASFAEAPPVAIDISDIFVGP